MVFYVNYQAIRRKRFYEEKERVHMVGPLLFSNSFVQPVNVYCFIAIVCVDVIIINSSLTVDRKKDKMRSTGCGFEFRPTHCGDSKPGQDVRTHARTTSDVTIVQDVAKGGGLDGQSQPQSL